MRDRPISLSTIMSDEGGGFTGNNAEREYEEAEQFLRNHFAFQECLAALGELEAAVEAPLLVPRPADIAESQALPAGAEAAGFEFLGQATKRELKARRRQRSKALIAAGVGPRDRKKIYRLEKRKGPEAMAKLDALFADIRAARSE